MAAIEERVWSSAAVGVATMVVRLWMHSLHYRVAYYDPRVDPFHPECKRPKIYLFWHEYLLCPLIVRAGVPMVLVVSRHRDADLLDKAARRLGFLTVRGSTYRGGAQALLKIFKKDCPVHIAITPDGPRGPRRSVAPGAIFLASRLQIPIVPLGFGYDRPLRIPTWDRFAVPRPGSRARCVVGPAIFVPEHLTREGLEPYRRLVAEQLGTLTELAEQWAAGQAELPYSVPLLARFHFERYFRAGEIDGSADSAQGTFPACSHPKRRPFSL